MKREIGERLIRELRGQIAGLMAATQLLTSLVREQGDERDETTLAMLEKGLYCMARTVIHMGLCQEETPIFVPQIMDLAGLCKEIGKEVEAVAPKMGVSFTWELEKESVMVKGDDSLLKAAILNLVSNAARAAGQGGEVSLRCKVAGDQCHVLVWDDGPELSSDDADANPLLKKNEGLGLGMEVTRRIVKLHGGSLLQEKNGEGGVEDGGEDSVEDGVGVGLAIPICHDKKELLKGPPDGPRNDVEIWGGLSPVLVEFAPQLPASEFNHKLLDQ